MIGRARLAPSSPPRSPAPGMGALGAFRAVPGSYSVEKGAPITPDQCPFKNQLYEDDTLCCHPTGKNDWTCRRVNVAEKGGGAAAPSGPVPASTDTCLRGLQLFLAQGGQLPYASATGLWNPETEVSLSSRFPNPRAYPGGPCAMLALLGLKPEQAPVHAGFAFPSLSAGGVSPGALAAVGIVALIAILAARRAG